MLNGFVNASQPADWSCDVTSRCELQAARTMQCDFDDCVDVRQLTRTVYSHNIKAKEKNSRYIKNLVKTLVLRLFSLTSIPYTYYVKYAKAF